MKNPDEGYDELMQEHLDNAVEYIEKHGRITSDGTVCYNKAEAIKIQYDINRGAL